MKKLHIIIALLFVLCILNVAFSFALETDTHEKINEFITKNILNGFSLNSYLSDQLGFSKGIEEEFKSEEKRKVWDWIKIGGTYEDKPPRSIPFLRSVNHFHNPLTNKGYKRIWNSSIVWSQLSGGQSPGGFYSWQDVRGYYYMALTVKDKNLRESNFAETFRGLGQLMHLVQDLSVPEHTTRFF